MLRVRCYGWLIAFSAWCCGLPLAQGDLISVGSIGTVNMTANSQSSAYVIPIYDYDETAPIVPGNLYAWSLRLKVVPLGGATGTVTIDLPSLAYAANNIIGDPSPASAPQTTPNSPTDVTIGSSSNAFGSYTVPNLAGGKTLASLKFNASADATGDFALRLVESGSLNDVYWTDENFDNRSLLVDGSPFVSDVSQIGTISLPLAAVPEPGSFLLVGGVSALAAWRTRRKNRKDRVAA